MHNAFADSLVDALLGSQVAGLDGQEPNRFSLDGLTLGAGANGTHEVRVRTAEAASLRVTRGAFELQVGSLRLHDLIATLRLDEGRARLSRIEVAKAEIAALECQGPVHLTPRSATEGPQGAWSLAPLAGADGQVRAQIEDATLIFDADVTVPIRHGQVDFNQASVEHVGPDSHMGVSKLGIYVDAPNGRSYLYQFSPAPVAGVGYEQRGAFLGQRVSDRGNLHLQPFAEAMLLHAAGGAGAGFTDQARQLLARTALSGFVQLGDGAVAGPGMQAELTGRAEECNIVRLHSDAVGRGVALDIASLAVRNAAMKLGAASLRCDEVSGTAKLQLLVQGKELRFALEVPQLQMTEWKS
jgi:hypothetical protein